MTQPGTPGDARRVHIGPEGGFSVGTLATASPQRPALHERAEALRESLGLLEDTLGRLGSRLEPVLQPSRPTPAADVTPDNDDDSWLAAFLLKTTTHVTELTNQVQTLTRRVDL